MFAKSIKKEKKMNKKLKIIGIVLALFCILGITGCQQSTGSGGSTGKYYAEMGILNKYDFEAIYATFPKKNSYTFDEIKAFRNKVSACQMDKFESKKDLSREEAKAIIIDSGYDQSTSETYMKSIDETGNMLFYYSVRNNPSKYAYLYIEKQ